MLSNERWKGQSDFWKSYLHRKLCHNLAFIKHLLQNNGLNIVLFWLANKMSIFVTKRSKKFTKRKWLWNCISHMLLWNWAVINLTSSTCASWQVCGRSLVSVNFFWILVSLHSLTAQPSFLSSVNQTIFLMYLFLFLLAMSALVFYADH